MAKAYKSEGHLWRDMSKRIILIFIVTAVVVFILPHTTTKEFNFQIDKPWPYNQLIAETEIPLYKSEEVLKHERDSLLKTFEPYYNFADERGEEMAKKFVADVNTKGTKLPKGVVNHVANQIRNYYDEGIISADLATLADKDTLKSIRLVVGYSAISRRVREFCTPVEVYENILASPVVQKHKVALVRCDINEYIEPNIIYDQERTEVEQNDLLGSIPVASGLIQVGEKIIDRGEVVTAHDHLAISSYIKEMNQHKASKKDVLMTYGGQMIFVFGLVTIFTLYLLLYRWDYFQKLRSTAMLYICVVVPPILVSLVMRNMFFTVYVLPLCMVPIFIRVFMDSRTAFITHFISMAIAALAVQKQFEFVVIQCTGGIVAIFALRELSRRAQVFVAALCVVFAEIMMYISLQLIDSKNTLIVDMSMVYHIITNGVLLLLSYPLMYLVEKAFGFISAVTLFELSDVNKPLLRRLSEVAPGTFQHSITVGNLASAIATRIRAKSLLVRVGALYHDIGKMRHPVFFTENQAGINPHKRLTEKESAQVVVSHVTEGLRLAEKEALPSIITDFIRTHHGAGMAKFFYVKYKNEHPDEEVDEAMFSYPGPNPFTREQAVLMMADACEAASRSLSEYTEESISTLVSRIIDGQVSDGFFRDCPITFHDIAMAKDVLTERLTAIYHTRIAYPELKK